MEEFKDTPFTDEDDDTCPSTELTFTCPECGEEVDEDDDTCPYCGAELFQDYYLD